MVDSKNNTDNDRALKISIETIIKDPEMLEKTKNMCKNAVKKFSFVIKYVPEQVMCDNVILEIGGMLMFIPDCHKDKKMMHPNLSLIAIRLRK